MAPNRVTERSSAVHRSRLRTAAPSVSEGAVLPSEPRPEKAGIPISAHVVAAPSVTEGVRARKEPSAQGRFFSGASVFNRSREREPAGAVTGLRLQEAAATAAAGRAASESETRGSPYRRTARETVPLLIPDAGAVPVPRPPAEQSFPRPPAPCARAGPPRLAGRRPPGAPPKESPRPWRLRHRWPPSPPESSGRRPAFRRTSNPSYHASETPCALPCPPNNY